MAAYNEKLTIDYFTMFGTEDEIRDMSITMVKYKSIIWMYPTVNITTH
ncbi:MAG: hypothetical protein AABY78_01520 [Nitrospirota bacterium]